MVCKRPIHIHDFTRPTCPTKYPVNINCSQNHRLGGYPNHTATAIVRRGKLDCYERSANNGDECKNPISRVASNFRG